MLSKTQFIDGLPNRTNIFLQEDRFLIFALEKAESLGIQFIGEIQRLWGAMLWETSLRESSCFATRRELDHYGRTIDESVMGVYAKLFILNIESFPRSKKYFGIFQRLDWLADCETDVSKGIITLSKDAASTHGISFADVEATAGDVLSQPFLRAAYLEDFKYVKQGWESLRKALKEDLRETKRIIPPMFFKYFVISRCDRQARRLSNTLY
ncbi:MAG TPA: hypothetical protein VF696_01060 [Candidatus Paceibacterota bacterium]